MKEKVVVIGNGVSGVNAGWILSQDKRYDITIISDETELFYSRTALMYVFMGQMKAKHLVPYQKREYDNKNIILIRSRVEQVDFEEKVLRDNKGMIHQYDILIIATGSKPRMIPWPGIHLEGISPLYHWQDLEKFERWSEKSDKAVIVGGGLIGIELAEMFHTRTIQTTLLVRESNYWDNVLPREEAMLVNNIIRNHHIDLRLETELKAFGTKDQKHLSHIETHRGERIECEMAGVTVGVVPNVDFLKDSNLSIHRGIAVNEYFETNVENVYAIGDCAEIQNPQTGRKSIEAVWYTGKIMGQQLAYNLIHDRKHPYRPGIWYNSAKFFNLEYQVYGNVPNNYNNPQLLTRVWKDQLRDRMIRINYDRDTAQVKGFNLMGVRFRQNQCLKWIEDKVKINQVVEHLEKANFDPEFYPKLNQAKDFFNRELNMKVYE